MSDDETAWTELLSKQRDVMGSIHRSVDNFKKIGKGNVTLAVARNRMRILDEYWIECKNLHHQLQFLAAPEDQATERYFVANEYETAEDEYMFASDYISTRIAQFDTSNLLATLTSAAGASHSNSDVPPGNQAVARSDAFVSVRLPTIELPHFSGRYTEWHSFSDLFRSLIDKNSALSEVQRLHYLKSSLDGEPSDLIKNLTITNDNYRIAWETLTARYDNKRVIITSHLNALLELPPIVKFSVQELKRVRDKAAEILSALKLLERPVAQWDDVIVVIILHKLDNRTKKEWELAQTSSTEFPTYAELDKFLANNIRALDTYRSVNENKVKDPPTAKPGTSTTVKSYVTTATTATSKRNKKCPLCSSEHFLYQCDQFKGQSAEQRLETAQKIRCCFNCLKKGHYPATCRSERTCSICSRRHHSLIHVDTAPRSNESVSAGSPPASEPSNNGLQAPVNVLLTSDSLTPRRSILLATAWVRLRSPSGQSVKVRALLDQGSESTFVTESVAQLLHAPRCKTTASVSGLGGSTTCTVRSIASFTIEPCIDSGTDVEIAIPINALVYKTLTSYAPVRSGNTASWSHFQHLPLADPNPLSPEPINLLIGADIYGALLRPGLLQALGALTAQFTVLGWVVFGPIPSTRPPPTTITVHHVVSNDELRAEMRRSWELEEFAVPAPYTEDEQLCENHFKATHSRVANRNYVVRLPFKSEPPIAIGRSLGTASKCFSALEKRLDKNPENRKLYCDFMDEYESLGHMSPVADLDDSYQTVYLPHHPVIRADSSTTQLRVVFNASSVTSNGTTLNNHMLTGPKLQADLPALLTQWRQHRIVFTADIAKMYRQIWVDDRDVDYQRILWRRHPSENLTAYRLLTVTYGTASAPYLAIRVLHQLADDERDRYPQGAELLKRNFYVDDALFGADDPATALAYKAQLTDLLQAGGFRLRRWACNHAPLLADVTPGDHELALTDAPSAQDSVKVLGLRWTPKTDSFRFRVNLEIPDTITKRTILSTVARLYDPLGWLAPVLITAKILLQELWLREISWDAPVPEDLNQKWMAFCQELPILSRVTIPRWTGETAATISRELHGYADASSRAYAAAVYLRVVDSTNQVHITLLLAKSKVAPVKQVSIPRLELCAVHLLSRLFEFLHATLSLESVATYGWTDSTIVLAWMRRHPSYWKTFVANRIADISRRAPTVTWRHVRSEDNPADCASRGLMPSEAPDHPLWWSGPPWLSECKKSWSQEITDPIPEVELERAIRKHVHIGVHNDLEWDLPMNLSSWPKILRVTAYVLRFTYRSLRRETQPSTALTGEEIARARRFWILRVQTSHFEDEIKLVKANQSLPKRNPLAKLNPKLDQHGVLRVGGRLRWAMLPYDERHPIILPRHRISDLIIEQSHLRSLHGGPQLTLAVIRQNFWILGAPQLVKGHIRKCIPCTRARAALSIQQMGDLPSSRVNPARPFSHTGLDYAGPIMVRASKGRGYQAHKAYIAVFVCLSVRAIHLELVSDYSTSTFLAALHRFTSRRGLPSDIYSDNGTNFKGADKELRTAFNQVIRDSDLVNHVASDGITWHFIPPSAPHFGGIWEAGVKSTKHHLHRIIGANTLTIEEMMTLLARIEACLNSRPLAALSADPENMAPLTPGHFLIGAPITALPEPSVLDIKENRLGRWQLLQRITEQFWRRWAAEYLHSLQQRKKWTSSQPNLRPNDLVLLKSDNLPPTKWQMGRIQEVHPGSDGFVRVVTIKTAQSLFKRPITQLCLLPIHAGVNQVDDETK